MRFSVQVSRHYGGSHGVGGQIGMHSYSEHDTMAQAKVSARNFARKFPKDEVLIYDNQTKRVKTVKALPKQNPASIPAQLRRLPSGEIQLKIPLSANVKAQVQAIRKALGKRVKSAVIVGSQMARRLANPQKITVYDNWGDPNVFKKLGIRVLHDGHYVYVDGERWAVKRDEGQYVLDYRAPKDNPRRARRRKR